MECKGGHSLSLSRGLLALLCAVTILGVLEAIASPASNKGVYGSAGTANPGATAAVPVSPALNASATVTVDVARRQPTSPLLYGVFFEEARRWADQALYGCWQCPGEPWMACAAACCWLSCGHPLRGVQSVPPPQPPAPCPAPHAMQIGHAGDGGLYAEMVQDRSFDAVAAAVGFAAGAGPGRLPISLNDLTAQQVQQAGCNQAANGSGASSRGCAWKPLKRRGTAACRASNDIIIAWSALPGDKRSSAGSCRGSLEHTAYKHR